jgi:hypothetical protein
MRSWLVVAWPILRAIPEVGELWDDPSEDLLFELLSDIEAGQGTFLIVERLTDPSGQTYVQTLRRDDGTYVVEHREGSADSHYGTIAPDMREAHRLITSWAFELPGWSNGYDWSPEQVDATGRDGRVELHYAAARGDVELVRRLCADQDVSPQDHGGWTPLHFAAQGSHAEAIRILVIAGADVDATDAGGNTPLFEAVFNSRGEGAAILALLAANADPDLPNSSGVTPRALANNIANYDVARFFADHPTSP